jgi:predicted PurR-regulated permease PerM
VAETSTPRRRVLDPERPLVRWGVSAWLLVGLAVLFTLAWHVAGLLSVVLFPLVLAIFPAAVVLPVARWLERRGAPPALAALLVTLSLLVFVTGLGTLVTLQVKAEISGLTDQLSMALDQLRQSVPFLSDLDPQELFSASPTGGDGTGGGTSSGGRDAGPGGGIPDGAGNAAMAALRGLVTFLVELLLGIVAVFFYVKDGDRIARWLQGLFPGRHRNDAGVVGAQVWEAVAGYIRGQAIVATVDGVLVAVGLVLLGIPLAVTLGVLVFVGAFVPVVGSIVAGTVAVGVALATKGLGAALATLAIIVGVQQLEGNVLAPLVLGRQLHIHPLAVLAAITAGAVLLGPFGAIIAVPLTASLARAAHYVRAEVA